MNFIVLDFIVALNELIEEGIIDQFEEMTEENLQIICDRAKREADE